MKSKLHVDERLTFMTKNLLLGILAVSLIVYLASMIINYYRSF